VPITLNQFLVTTGEGFGWLYARKLTLNTARRTKLRVATGIPQLNQKGESHGKPKNARSSHKVNVPEFDTSVFLIPGENVKNGLIDAAEKVCAA
jgi:hypothetical protein